jgi:AcrR family transcriptional regulator
MPKATGKRGSYHHGDLRAALVAAGREVLLSGGLEALTLREAARRAGVSPAAPYRHFADRASLVAAIAAEGFRDLATELRRSLEAGAETGAALALRSLAAAYLGFALKHPALYRLMFSAEIADKAAHPALEAAAGDAFGVLEGAIVASQREGAVSSGPPRPSAVAAWSLVHGFASLWLEGHAQVYAGEAPPLETVNELAALLFLGLAPR